ncbi:hypothetical protein AKJ58_01605 [candidate division MSBL1 archaeon SCGC-AAA385D11]|uniref:Peptidase S54 rhomboid domain-containing protein n=1 Tax=candidate division MSBL1 archaeon SCGC-AAA385D11 TaxID=1698286 RepID=A0A133VN55_9EURY|nr:hypothetical protein AKJ58_01605 [candidate division MSBL1 archaeon SCGC-AAA385D11]
MGFELRFELLKEIAEHVELKDILLIVSVPVVAILVFLLPDSTQEALVLNYKDPSPVTLFTKTFVHRGVDHLKNNLTAYIFFAVPSFLMSALTRQKRRFYLCFLLFVLVFPFILSSLNLHFIDAETGRGLSGVVSAFLGFMPVSVYLFLKEKMAEDLKISFSVSLVLFALGSIAFLFVGPLAQKLLWLVIIYSLAVFTLWSSTREVDFGKLIESLKGELARQNYLLFSTVSVLVFLLSVPLLFPVELVRGGGFVNVLAHYFGFALGFFVPYLAVSLHEAKRNL